MVRIVSFHSQSIYYAMRVESLRLKFNDVLRPQHRRCRQGSPNYTLIYNNIMNFENSTGLPSYQAEPWMQQ